MGVFLALKSTKNSFNFKFKRYIFAAQKTREPAKGHGFVIGYISR